MVRLQKRFAYKYKNKDHCKYVVTIPSETVEQLQLAPDTESEVTMENKNVLLKPGVGIVQPKPTKKKG